MGNGLWVELNSSWAATINKSTFVKIINLLMFVLISSMVQSTLPWTELLQNEAWIHHRWTLNGAEEAQAT